MTYIKKKLKFSFYLLIIKGRSAGNASTLAKDYVFLWHEEMENFKPLNGLFYIFQIAMPKGVIQDWGLVEFFDPEDTEATQTALNGSLIHGHSIRIHFCIPGVNAINIYMQASKKAENTLQTRFLGHTIERKSGACSVHIPG